MEMAGDHAAARRSGDGIAGGLAAEEQRVRFFVDGGGDRLERAQRGAEFVERAQQVALHGSVRADAGDGFLEFVERLADIGGQAAEIRILEGFAGGGGGGFDFPQGRAGLGDGGLRPRSAAAAMSAMVFSSGRAWILSRMAVSLASSWAKPEETVGKTV